jgi:hypothetical protein
MISRCSKTRDRTMNRSEWSSEQTTDVTNRGYRRTEVTSIDATSTVFSAATALALCCDPREKVGVSHVSLLLD